MLKTEGMDPKTLILERIRAISQPEKPYPPVAPEPGTLELVEAFEKMVRLSGSSWIRLNTEAAVIEYLQGLPDVAEWISTWPPLKGITRDPIAQGMDARQKIPGAILPGQLGVAENGAVWVAEEGMGWRALPFLAEHLVLVLRTNDLVPHMHAAYARISPGDYGVFIAGPSKTADIEQHLVLGAQGPLAHTVIILG